MVVCEQLRVRFPPKASQLFADGQKETLLQAAEVLNQ